MAGAMLPPTTRDVAGTAVIAVNPLAWMEPTSAALGPAIIVRTRVLAKITVVVTAPVTPLTLPMAGAMRRLTTQDVAGMVVIAVNPHVLTELTRVALWDTPVTIHMHVRTVPVVALNRLGINLTT
jgi:hypothetical protein